MPNDRYQQEDEISLKELVDKAMIIWKYLIQKWAFILIAGMLGAGVGLAYAWYKPIKYKSRISFVVEDSKSSMGGLASLAGQFGFDIGGSSNSTIFSGDNILLFLRSESLCRETLLTNYDSSGNKLLADKYAEASQMKAKWLRNTKIGAISFAKFKNEKFPRVEDSLMQLITKQILEKDLQVGKPDKKASFIEVSVTMRDELLSESFSKRLVQIATDHYVESKTKLKALNVAKLQHRADSLGALLISRTYTAAASQQSLIDLNPALRMAPVTSEITARDKTMIATIYAEVVKNLEISKVALNQETPTIQIVDESTLPLKKEKASKPIAAIVTGALVAFLCIALLLLRRWWTNLKAKNPVSQKKQTLQPPAKVVLEQETGV